jgi:multiple sugar transport system substrate-binding protein
MPPPREESDVDRVKAEDESTGRAPEDTFRYTDIAPGYRDHVTRYGTDRAALPYGGSALVLVYRRDALEREANRVAARDNGLVLDRPPSTWSQLDALARFFQGRDWDGDGSADHGIALVLGSDAEGQGDAIFMARAASLGQHPDHYSFFFDYETMTPRIASPPFVEALEGLIALKAAGPPGMDAFDADAARASFRSGKVAMLIDRAERAATWSHRKPLGVAPLPGSERVFEPGLKTWLRATGRNAPSLLPRGGGWLVGIRADLTGSKRDAAMDLASYLANPETSNRTRGDAAFPMLPFRIGQMSLGLPDPTAAPDVDSRLWSDAVSRTLLADRVVPSLRIPDAHGYLDDLAKGRAAALAGDRPQQALEQVAAAWAARTKARGPKRQAWHYRRSLNLPDAVSEPPKSGT